MKKTILLFIAALAFCACERDFDVKDQMSDGVVRISFAPSNDHDSTFFYVQATSPVKNGYKAAKTAGESVSATVNGKAITLEKAPQRSSKDGCQAYWTDYKFRSGDEIMVEASVPGIEPVYSSTTVPASFPEVRWDCRAEDGQICFEIEHGDTPSASGYYGVAVMAQSSDGSTSYCTPAASEGLHIFQPERINENWLQAECSSKVLAWKDLPGKSSKTCRQQIKVLKADDAIRYRLVFYSFDENSFNHLRAQENILNDKFAIPGPAPVSFAFTNVRNGAGICGSYITSETDWFSIK